jgi:hypothetical protein
LLIDEIEPAVFTLDARLRDHLRLASTGLPATPCHRSTTDVTPLVEVVEEALLSTDSRSGDFRGHCLSFAGFAFRHGDEAEPVPEEKRDLGVQAVTPAGISASVSDVSTLFRVLRG